MGDDKRYEEAALRGKLNEEEKLEVVEAFSRIRDLSKTAISLNLPIKLVRKTLNDRKYEAYAKNLIGHTVGAEFYGLMSPIEGPRFSARRSDSRERSGSSDPDSALQRRLARRFPSIPM